MCLGSAAWRADRPSRDAARRRRFLTLCVLAATVLTALATIQFWVAAFIYRPTMLTRTDPRAWGLTGAVPMRVGYGNGAAITGWWQPPTAGCAVALVVHGRSANVSTRAAIMRRLTDDGIGVLMFDYRGYGASPGRASERHLAEDTATAYRWLRSRGVAADAIVVVGQSIGNSPAALLAARQPVGALVLVSPFTDLPDALAERLPWLPVRLLPWRRNRFEVSDALRGFRGPTLLVASEADGLVPIGNARRLRAVATRAQWLDASPLRHDGMLQAIASDGRLTRAIRSLVPRAAASCRR